jgi:hypothetical protein
MGNPHNECTNADDLEEIEDQSTIHGAPANPLALDFRSGYLFLL